MKRTLPEDMWCPLGRISIQNIEGGKVDAVKAGAFNRVVIEKHTYLSSLCIGNKCPLYRRGLNPFSWGRCLAAKQRLGWWIIAAAIIMAVAPYLPWVEFFNS